MAWHQLQIKATSENAEIIGDMLLGLGSEAVTVLDAKDQPLLEPGPGETPLWDDAWVSALLDKNIDVDEFIRELKTVLNVDHLDYRLIHLEDKNWTREWLEHFHPLQFGEKLWVTPQEHVTEIEDKAAAIVVLDPGLAFGTGSHPTTAMCLAWLEKTIKQNDVVIDYGCGSGILAIAAVKLGAEKVYCIDNDPQALIATEDNANRNNLTDKQIIPCLPEDFKAFEADVLVANILSNPLIELAPKFFNLVKKTGHIGLSGILLDQVEKIQHVYGHPFELDLPQLHEDWALISGKKL